MLDSRGCDEPKKLFVFSEGKISSFTILACKEHYVVSQNLPPCRVLLDRKIAASSISFLSVEQKTTQGNPRAKMGACNMEQKRRED
ncbi:hypothetical protein MUK42_07631 [Musa troglodytarum]|uniref:Uncharacterized protein n=1 Tax=Musa troglodytarum TaxID=320322 RepID=A0A9E7JV87_9LILI|nr:hypothetical protein MUK42_07631 [Musa troglodytarum]